jgi:hypothetical protein
MGGKSGSRFTADDRNEPLLTFLSRVFASSDFTQQPPTFINRHWILHGGAPVDWTLSDALRLVNSLTTLVFLFVTVGQPKLEASAQGLVGAGASQKT